MGRGDKRTAKGKRTRGSFGNTRVREQLKARARNNGKGKKAETKTEQTA